MKDDSAAILDDLLSLWHSWQLAAKLTRGHNRSALVCGEYRISRQYDDANGKLDDDLDAMRSRAVDREVQHMADPHRAAIYCNARNLQSGSSVWTSPRLPADKAARDRIVAEARGQLIRRLMSAGVI